MHKRTGLFCLYINTNLPSLFVLVACLLLGLTAGGSFAQTVSIDREPYVTGCVVDYAPFQIVGPTDTVESGMLIGNINDTVRKAVLEYDISDLVPGVVDSARITGMIGPNNSSPAGYRTHNFTISAGNGIVDVHDINQPGTSVGWFKHYSGVKTTFDYDITGAFRRALLSDPDYLRQVIRPGNDPQGWDAVYSLSPSPKLELEVRPTTESTVVYYQTPTASAAAHAQDGGAFTVDPSASEAPVMDWTYAPYEQGRGLMEFDLSSIPAGATVQWAKLDVYIGGLQTGGWGTIGPDLEIVGYAGDGVATAGDVDAPGALIGTSSELLSTGVFSWDIDTDFVELLLNTDDHLGLRIQPGVGARYRAKMTLNSLSSPETTPHLVIGYEIPEPCDLVADIAPVGAPDGIVDGADLGALLARWKDTGDSVADIAPVGAPDGIVDGADLGALLARWKDTCPEASPAVPEPATLTMLALGGLAMLRRRRK